MNQSAIIFHLKEAKEQLDQTIAELETSQDYDEAEFQVAHESPLPPPEYRMERTRRFAGAAQRMRQE